MEPTLKSYSMTASRARWRLGPSTLTFLLLWTCAYGTSTAPSGERKLDACLDKIETMPDFIIHDPSS